MIDSRSSAQNRHVTGRVMLAALAVVALTLGGCGRKGFLDLPPNPAVKQSSATDPAQPDGAAQPGGAAQPATINPLGWLDTPPEDQPAATPGVGKKRIILDKILD